MKKVLVLSLMVLGFASLANAQAVATSEQKALAATCRVAAVAPNCEGWTNECTAIKNEIRSGVILEEEQIDPSNQCSE
jgi:hypothetical protein